MTNFKPLKWVIISADRKFSIEIRLAADFIMCKHLADYSGRVSRKIIYAECRYAQYRYAECRGATIKPFTAVSFALIY